MKIKVVKEMLEFFYKPARYKVAYGGRGSGKSHTVARLLLIKAIKQPLRILNVRYVQNSIKESVYQLYADLINHYGFASFFTLYSDKIEGKNGSMFLFKGIQNDLAQSLKSLEGVDICWIEEAQTVTQSSWDLLVPTIRKEHSEIWLTFNPCHKDDVVYQRFVANPCPTASMVKKINFWHNPWFPSVLKAEMEWDKNHCYQRYLHIWEGQLQSLSNEQPFKAIKVAKFNAEQGMSCFIDPSYGGADKTGITFGYWQDGLAYAWVYEEEGNFALTYPKILTQLEAKGVVKITLESNGDKGVLLMLIKDWLAKSNVCLTVLGYYSYQNKLEKIWHRMKILENILTLHSSCDYDSVLSWHEKAKHDDGIDSLVMWGGLGNF